MANSFKIKYSVVVWALLFVVAVASLLGFAWNVYNLVYFINAKPLKIITYSLLVLTTGALFVIVVGVIAFGKYTVKNGVLCMKLGFFTLKTPTEEVLEITLFKKSNKLVTYFSDSKYAVVLISPADYENFILALRNQNKKIIYNTRIDGEDTPY